jgi:REP element-mobilizing transposase RayT
VYAIRPYKKWCFGIFHVTEVTMTYQPDIHHRHSIRLKDYDYSQAGAYFVTLCAWQRECLFGDIVDGEMRLNALGQAVLDEWNRTPEIRVQVSLDVSVVMPNHFHGIIAIDGSTFDGGNVVRAYCNTPLPIVHNQLRSPSQTIGAIVRGFKSAVTTQINVIRQNPNCPVWQRNYFERVIRNDAELDRAREYIINNPLKWELDKEHPANV